MTVFPGCVIKEPLVKALADGIMISLPGRYIFGSRRLQRTFIRLRGSFEFAANAFENVSQPIRD